MVQKRDDMTGRVVPLGSREAAEPPCPPDIAGRLSLQSRLSREAWELTGRALPSYTRATMPIAIRRLWQQGSD